MEEQHTNQLTLAISKDAKNDTVQMRRLTVIAMILAPPTFMSSIFSMTFIDYNPQTKHLNVRESLWIFVVSSVILTIFVFVCWWYAEPWRKQLEEWFPHLKADEGAVNRKESILLSHSVRTRFAPAE